MKNYQTVILFFLISSFFFLYHHQVLAATYPWPCASCQNEGDWCIETGGYGCEGVDGRDHTIHCSTYPAPGYESYGGPGTSCPSNAYGYCTCAAHTGTYNWCGNKCIHILDCPGPPTVPTDTPTPVPQCPECNSQVYMTIYPSTLTLGETVNFSISGAGSTWIADYLYGVDTNSCTNFNGYHIIGWPGSADCTSNQVGTFYWTHTWKEADQFGQPCRDCSKTEYYTIQDLLVSPSPTSTITLTPTPSLTITPSPVPLIQGSIYEDPTAIPGLFGACVGNTSQPVNSLDSATTIQAYQGINPDNLGSITGANFSLMASIPCLDCYTVKLNLPPGGEWKCACNDTYECEITLVGAPDNNINFFVKKREPANIGWWQVIGGNVYSGAVSNPAVKSIIPQECNAPCRQALNLAKDTLINTPGFIFTKGGNLFDNTKIHLPGEREVSQGFNGHALGFSLPDNEKFYNFYSLLNNQIKPLANESPSGKDKPASPGVYSASNLTLNQNNNWQINDHEQYVVFVDGNLTISSTIPNSQVITVSKNGGFLAFIVKNNIIIDQSVGYTNKIAAIETALANIEGVYVADQDLIIDGLGVNDRQFIGAGTFVGWNSVYVNRDLGLGGYEPSENDNIPAASFVFRPDLMFSIPTRMKITNNKWQEIDPRSF